MVNSIYSMDRFFELGRGDLPRLSNRHQFGRNPDVNIATDPEDIWSYGGTHTYMTVPAPMFISSSAAANDDDQVIVHEGVDDLWNSQVVNVTPNNQTAVIIPQGNRIDTYMISLAALVAGPPAGTMITQAGTGASMTVVGSDTTHNTIWGYTGDTFDLVGALTDPTGTMNPAAPVPTAFTACSFWLRSNRAFNSSANVTNGDLYIAEQDTLAVGVPTTATRVHNMINIGMEQSQSTLYSVPLNYNAALLNGWCTLNGAARSNVTVNYVVRMFNGVFRSQFIFGVDGNSNSHFDHHFDIPQVIPAKTDLKVIVQETDTNATDVSAGYELILEDTRI